MIDTFIDTLHLSNPIITTKMQINRKNRRIDQFACRLNQSDWFISFHIWEKHFHMQFTSYKNKQHTQKKMRILCKLQHLMFDQFQRIRNDNRFKMRFFSACCRLIWNGLKSREFYVIHELKQCNTRQIYSECARLSYEIKPDSQHNIEKIVVIWTISGTAFVVEWIKRLPPSAG